jgi:hypothetical protein
MTDLIQETKVYSLSTRSISGTCLNSDINYKSHFKFDILDMIPIDEKISHIYISVPSATIPCSFYNINSSNNQLTYKRGTESQTTYTFPEGNYSASLFITHFNANMSPTVCTYNNTTCIFTFTDTSSLTFYGSSSISFVMGFSDTVSSISNIIVMPRLVNFFPTPRIDIHCAEISNTSCVGQNVYGDVLCSILNTSRPNGLICYQSPDNCRHLYRGGPLNQIIIKITDDDGDLINFHGISSYFQLQIDIYRQPNQKADLFRNLVSLMNSSV